MKRFLSILLATLLVMSSFATVALAADTITFTPTMALEANDVIKAGTKVRFAVEAADGANVTYYNNGTAVTPDIITTDVAGDDKFTQTVALTVNSGTNVFTAKVGNTESAATTINAVKYVHEENFYDETTFKTIGTEVQIGGRTGVINPESNSRIANNNTKTADIFEVSFEVYLPELPVASGGKLIGFYYKESPTSAGGYLDQLVSLDKNGTTLFTYMNESDYDATGTITDAYTLSAADWHTVKYYINAASKTIDYYIDDILVIKDHNLRLPTHDFVQVQCFWSGIWDGLYIDNFAANGMSSVSMNSTIASGDVTEGTKASVTASNLENGQSVVKYVNGIATTLGTTSGTYYIDIPAGYSTVSAAILNADGTVVRSATGEELKTPEAIYTALPLTGTDTVTVYTDDDFSSTPASEATMPADLVKDAKWPEDYWNGVVERRETGVQEKSTGGNPGEMLLLYHAYDIMNYHQLDGTTDADGDGYYDYKYTADTKDTDGDGDKTELIIESRTTANGENIFAGSVLSNFANIGMLEYSIDIKFGDDWDQAAFRAASGVDGSPLLATFISFAARPGGTRTWFYPFRISKSGLVTTVWGTNASGTETFIPKTHSEIDLTEWHEYKMVMDPTGNRMWLYVDGALVHSGKFGSSAFTSVERMGVSSVATNSAGKHTSMYVDNIYYATHSATYATTVNAPAAIEGNVTDSSASVAIYKEAFVTAYPNLQSATILLIDEKGVADIKTYDVASAPSYKTFGFNKTGIKKVLVWNWGTLAPVVASFKK